VEEKLEKHGVFEGTRLMKAVTAERESRESWEELHWPD
jgi:hypothetical protein